MKFCEVWRNFKINYTKKKVFLNTDEHQRGDQIENVPGLDVERLLIMTSQEGGSFLSDLESEPSSKILFLVRHPTIKSKRPQETNKRCKMCKDTSQSRICQSKELLQTVLVKCSFFVEMCSTEPGDSLRRQRVASQSVAVTRTTAIAKSCGPVWC